MQLFNIENKQAALKTLIYIEYFAGLRQNKLFIGKNRGTYCRLVFTIYPRKSRQQKHSTLNPRTDFCKGCVVLVIFQNIIKFLAKL